MNPWSGKRLWVQIKSYSHINDSWQSLISSLPTSQYISHPKSCCGLDISWSVKRTQSVATPVCSLSLERPENLFMIQIFWWVAEWIDNWNCCIMKWWITKGMFRLWCTSVAYSLDGICDFHLTVMSLSGSKLMQMNFLPERGKIGPRESLGFAVLSCIGKHDSTSHIPAISVMARPPSSSSVLTVWKDGLRNIMQWSLRHLNAVVSFHVAWY